MPYDPYDPLTSSADALMGQTLAARMAPAGPVFPLPNTGAQTDALPAPSTSYVGEVGNPPPVADGPMVPGALAGMPTGALPAAPAAIRQPAPQEPAYDPRGEMSRMGMNMVRYGTPAERLQGLQMMQQALLPNEEERAARERERLMHVIDIAPVDDATKQRAAIGLHLGQKPEDLMKTMGLDVPSMFGAPTTNPDGSPIDPNVFFSKLPVQMQNTLKAIDEGRQAPPSSFALKPSASGRPSYWQTVLDALGIWKPGYDLTTWKTRNETRAAFGHGGQEAKTVTSLGTAMQHIKGYVDAIDALGNNNLLPFMNAPVNEVRAALSDKQQSLLKQAKTMSQISAAEVARAAKGAAPDQHEILAWQDVFSPNNTPEAARGVAQRGVAALYGRLSPLLQQYNRGMQTNHDPMTLMNMIAPEGHAALKALGIDAEGNVMAKGGASGRVRWEVGPDGQLRRAQ